MSEKYNGNTGWEQNEEGDIVAPSTQISSDFSAIYKNKAELEVEHPEYNNADNADDADIRRRANAKSDSGEHLVLTQEEAHALNEQARKDRLSNGVGARKSRKPKEMPRPGKSNWDW